MEEELLKKLDKIYISNKISDKELLKKVSFFLENYDCSYKKKRGDEEFYLGYFYMRKNNNFKAKKYFNLATVKQHSLAMNHLGTIYYKIEKNYKKAKKYYKMAIKEGNSNAMYNLGFYYDMIKKKYKKAIKYYKMAIDRGNVLAMNNLGVYYFMINKNFAKGKRYLKMAVQKGDSSAMNNLGTFLLQFENYIDAKKYYKMAIKEGNSSAIINLGRYYENVKENYFKAIEYYKKAIKNGCDDAKNNLNSCIKKILDNNIKLSPELYKILNDFNFDKDENNLIKKQLNISKITWIVPKKENIKKYILKFKILLKVAKTKKRKIPYWIIRRIGGYFFI